jgi:hypothetical protein
LHCYKISIDNNFPSILGSHIGTIWLADIAFHGGMGIGMGIGMVNIAVVSKVAWG